MGVGVGWEGGLRLSLKHPRAELSVFGTTWSVAMTPITEPSGELILSRCTCQISDSFKPIKAQPRNGSVSFISLYGMPIGVMENL